MATGDKQQNFIYWFFLFLSYFSYISSLFLKRDRHFYQLKYRFFPHWLYSPQRHGTVMSQMPKQQVLMWDRSRIQAHTWTRSFSSSTPSVPTNPPLLAQQWYAPCWMCSAYWPADNPHWYRQSSRSLQQTGPSFSHKARGIFQPLRPAMKQTLSELMRMSRICRMVFATCLGSFILVIFYFQSMFQPGRISLFPSFLLDVWVCVVRVDEWHLAWQPPGMLTHRFVLAVQ